MINENLIDFLKKTEPGVGLAAKMERFNADYPEMDAELRKQYLQALWLDMETFKTDFVAPFYEALNEVTETFANTVGLNNGIQTPDGEVYEVVVPDGGYTFYKHIGFKKATISRAAELGFEKADKRKK